MLKRKKESITTISQLARVIERGFLSLRSELSKKVDKSDLVIMRLDINEVAKDVSNLAGSTKLALDEISRDMAMLASKTDIEGLKQRLTNIDNRLDNVATHERRLVRLEHEVGITNN